MPQDLGAEPGTSGDATEVVRAYFDGYARALTAGDAATIASLWEAPALVLSDEGSHAVESQNEVRAFFSGAKERYNAHGIVETRAHLLALSWPTERIAIARVRWPLLDEDGNELGEESTTYTLRRDDNGKLRVRVAVAHGTTTRH